jgi:hypothetical protein
MTNPEPPTLAQQFNARRVEIDRREASMIEIALQWSATERPKLQS